MQIQKINTIQSFNLKNTNQPRIATLNKSYQFDTVNFTSKRNLFEECVNIRELNDFIRKLAQGIISKDSDKVIGGFKHEDMNNSTIYKYISGLNDRLKINTIKESFKRIDEFNQNQLNTLKIDENCIVETKKEAALLIDLLKNHFAYSAGSIQNSNLRFTTIQGLLDSPEYTIKEGAMKAIASFENQRTKDKLIKSLANQKGSFKVKEGIIFNKLKYILENVSDKLQLQLLEKHVATLSSKTKIYHRISDIQKFKNPQKLAELTKYLIPKQKDAVQQDIPKLIMAVPKGQLRDDVFKYYLDYQHSRGIREGFWDSISFNEMCKLIEESNRATKLYALEKANKFLDEDYCMNVINSL